MDFASSSCAAGFDWYAERSPGLAPLIRSDIDPLAMRHFLEHVALVDVQGGRFHFALVGGHIDAEYDEPLKGRHLDTLDLNSWSDYWRNAFATPVARCHPVMDRVRMAWRRRSFKVMEYLLIPISAPDGRVCRLLGVIDFSISVTGATASADPPE